MNGRNTWLAAGSVLAALGASLCCVLPLVVAVTGVGSAALGTWFAPARPYLAALTFLALGFAFYRAYRREPCAAGEGCTLPRQRRRRRLLTWSAAVLALAMLSFPYATAWVKSPAGEESGLQTAAFRVTGMTCGGCEVGVRQAVAKLDGVERVEASYRERRALVVYDDSRVSPAQIEAAIERLGYGAELEHERRTGP